MMVNQQNTQVLSRVDKWSLVEPDPIVWLYEHKRQYYYNYQQSDKFVQQSSGIVHKLFH